MRAAVEKGRAGENACCGEAATLKDGPAVHAKFIVQFFLQNLVLCSL
jgi:hypothetical protein